MRGTMAWAGALLLAALAMPSAAQDASLSITTRSGTITAPAQGMGQIVFFRPNRLMGAALGCTVFENDAQIARLGNGRYYVVAATPGRHEFATKGFSEDRLSLEVEPGETYYVRCNIATGLMAGGANLSPSDKAAFVERAGKMRSWEPKDDGAAD